MNLTHTNLEILRYLNQYRFLTVPQLVRLGVGHYAHISRSMQKFPKGIKAMLDYLDLGVLPGRGRLHRLYYLKKPGAKLLQETYRLDDDEVYFQAVKPPFLQDYFHRVATIDFHISLDLFAQKYKCKIPFFHVYFDTKGANRGTPKNERLRRMSKVKLGEYSLIPDAIFMLTDPTGKPHLFAVEIYNGRDTKRVHKQLEKHRQAVIDGAVGEEYGLKMGCRTLSIFEIPEARNSAIKRIEEDSKFSNLAPFFAFKTSEESNTNFYKNWHFIHGENKSIF